MNKFNNFYKVLISCLLVLQQGCGVLSEVQPRVVGGVPTTIKKIPYLVQIENNGSFYCGGSVLTEYHILTAAHCVENTLIEQLVVKAGASKLTDRGTITANVSDFMIPGVFNTMTFDQDVAVLKLKTPLKSIPTAPLSLNGWKPGNKLKLYGWGKLGENDNNPNQLQTTTVRVVDKDICSQMYTGRRNITESMFCAYATNRNSCYGDSGGPALINGKVVGIVSWGIGCARREFPAVYADVKVLHSFIDHALKTL